VLWSLLAVAVPSLAVEMTMSSKDGLQSFICPHLSRHFAAWDELSNGGFKARFGQKILQELPAECAVEEQESKTEAGSFLQVGMDMRPAQRHRHSLLMRSDPPHASRPALVPYPKSVSLLDPSSTSTAFALSKGTTIELGEGISEDMPHVAASLASLRKRLDDATAQIPQEPGDAASKIVLNMQEGEAEDSESYKLTVQDGKMLLEARGPEGFSYGVTTIQQMIPLAVSPNVESFLELSDKVEAGSLPAMVIEDAPAFKWRGVHLDVSRHFFPPEDVKKLLKTMAAYKLNRFHWHLTDDQGWRLPVKGYPELTKTGAGPRFKEDEQMPSGDSSEGSYTEEDIKDVLAFAKARHIQVIPEIDVPGHVAAAIAAYPELGNQDFPPPKGPQHEFGVHKWTLAPTKASVAFLEAVFSEVSRLFPDSDYIHFGGDEAPHDQWVHSKPETKKEWEFKGHGKDTQSYFNQKVSEIIRNNGKKMAGWDEVQSFASLPQDAVVFAWRGDNELKKALLNKRSAVNAVNTPYYLDHLQGPEQTEPKAIGGPIATVETVYNHDPLPAWVTKDQKKYVLGAQVQLWSEYFPKWSHVEYMAFPRAIALAERLWTPKEACDYPDFKERLAKRLNDLENWGVKYHAI